MSNDLHGNAGILQRFKRLESEDVLGTLALESSLDTAVCILNYRLSRATVRTSSSDELRHVQR